MPSLSRSSCTRNPAERRNRDRCLQASESSRATRRRTCGRCHRTRSAQDPRSRLGEDRRQAIAWRQPEALGLLRRRDGRTGGFGERSAFALAGSFASGAAPGPRPPPGVWIVPGAWHFARARREPARGTWHQRPTAGEECVRPSGLPCRMEDDTAGSLDECACRGPLDRNPGSAAVV